MLRPRIIPCLLVHQGGLVKTQGFKEPKYVGDPINAVRIFNEKEADELATETLIPPDVWASSAAKADPTALNVCSLANAIGRSPAIVAGRVRHETKNFRLLTHFVGQGMVRKHFPDQWILKEQGRSATSGPVKTGPSPVGSVADSRMSGTVKLTQLAEQSQGRQRRGSRQPKAKL